MNEHPLLTFARRELEYAGYTQNSPNERTAKCVINMIEYYLSQVANPHPFPYDVELVYKLLRKELLSPLTLKEEEFNKVCDGLWQNLRMPSIFKSKEGGVPYNINAFILATETYIDGVSGHTIKPKEGKQHYGTVWEMRDSITTGRKFVNCYIKESEYKNNRYIPKPQFILHCTEVVKNNGDSLYFVEAESAELKALESMYDLDWSEDSRVVGRDISSIK